MPQFLFAYGVPTGYTPRGPGAMAAWKDWFDSSGGPLLNRVNPVSDAATLAKTWPAVDVGAGVEIGRLVEPTSS